MPNYTDIPTWETWKKDSAEEASAWSFRMSDHVLGIIDGLVTSYHDNDLVAVQRETMYYMREAVDFWLSKNNVVPKNTAPTGLNSTNLPAKAKVSGDEGRRGAMEALRTILQSKLIAAFAVNSDGGLRLALREAYGATIGEHGIEGDQAWLTGPGLHFRSIYLTDAGLQRMYKLRYRGGLGWRWNFVSQCYSLFDSTDNRESEKNDEMVHFVMSLKGGIYAGFDKSTDDTWFKHSSFLGGADTLAAGRMKVVQGVVTIVENDSGHYSPNYKHMLNVLNRLKLYGCNIGNTRVKRHSDKRLFSSAEMLAHQNSWPDGSTGH